MKMMYPKKDKLDDLMLEVVETQNSSKNDTEKETSSIDLSERRFDPNVDIEEDKGCVEAKSIVKWLLIFIVVIGILFGILFGTGILDKSDFEGVPGLGVIDFKGFFDSDPFGGEVTVENPETAYRWYNPRQTGLELTVLNALSDDWQQEFDTAMNDWDQGEPDTLTLTTRRVDPDPFCEPVTGLLKVCNGDYGRTDWRGLNVLILNTQERWIQSSTAKMNEHFLSQAPAAHRQYTMCHELGHGFGLPHWDENFYNRNVGNCMDYTSRPRSNQRPGRENFLFLKELYGVVGGTTAPAGTAPPRADNVPNEEEEDNRLLRRRREDDEPRDGNDLPEAVMVVYREALEGKIPSMSRSRRLLESRDDGEATYFDLGYENYGMLIYKLKAVPFDDDEE